MTRRALLFISAALLIFVLGELNGVTWVYVTDSLIWATLAISAVISWLSVSFIKANIHLVIPDDRVNILPIEGDEVVIVVEIHNPQIWPCFGVSVTSNISVNQIPTQEIRFYFPFVGPRARRHLEGKMVYRHRGQHTARLMTVTSSAPFGLFRRSRNFMPDISALVTPKPFDLAADTRRAPSHGNLAQTSPSFQDGELSGSRPYMAGDVARHIHWRNSARAGRLMTKVFTSHNADQPILTFGVDDDSQSHFEDVVRLAAGVGSLYTRSGNRIRLRMGAREQEMGSQELLRKLAVISESDAPRISDSLRFVPIGSTVLVCMKMSDSIGIDTLRKLAGRLTNLIVWAIAPEDHPLDRTEEDVRALELGGAKVYCLPLPINSDSNGGQDAQAS